MLKHNALESAVTSFAFASVSNDVKAFIASLALATANFGQCAMCSSARRADNISISGEIFDKHLVQSPWFLMIAFFSALSIARS